MVSLWLRIAIHCQRILTSQIESDGVPPPLIWGVRQSNEQRRENGQKYTMKGVQDLLEVFEDKITITPKGVLGFLNKGINSTLSHSKSFRLKV